MRGSDISVYACSWMSGINVPVCSIQPGYWKLLGIAAPHQSFLISGSEVPLIKKSSFPPGEAKGQLRKLVPFNRVLTNVQGSGADSIRPYGCGGNHASTATNGVHPLSLASLSSSPKGGAAGAPRRMGRLLIPHPASTFRTAPGAGSVCARR